jgi:hypothetical protein
VQIDKLTADEKRALAAQFNAKLSQWQIASAADAERSERMKAEHEAWQRRFDADKLVRDLYGTSYGHDELRTVIEAVLADLPEELLDDEALARLKRRHASQYLVKKLVELKGPMSAANEALIQQKLEAAMAATFQLKKENKND